MGHLKRHAVPKTWPLSRKGTTFVVRANGHMEHGLPLLVGLRDLLGVVENRREAKKALLAGHVLVNGQSIKDERKSLTLFDVVSFVPSDTHYRLTMSKNGKFTLVEIKKGEKDSKVSKIMNKTKLKGNKLQINLLDGRNYLPQKIEAKVNDSVVINLSKHTIEKTLPLEKGSNALVYQGKHSGKEGKIAKVDEEKRMVEIKTTEEVIHVQPEYMIVVA